jgi:hypothetical protein
MKKTTLLFFAFLSVVGFAQQKSTGNISLLGDGSITANLTLNNTTSVATLVLSGPNDRWFALKFGYTGHPMTSGVDGVYWNGTTLIDGTEGGFAGLGTDAVQNWTISAGGSTLSGGVRTITATRPFNTGASSDYVFVYANTTISLAEAKGANPNYTMNSSNQHCGTCRETNTAVPLTILGVEDFSLRASQVYPNPSNGEFLVKTKTTLEKINVYTQTGSFVKTVEVKDVSDAVEINITGLQTGIYLIELVNDNEKSWKKVIVN